MFDFSPPIHWSHSEYRRWRYLPIWMLSLSKYWLKKQMKRVSPTTKNEGYFIGRDTVLTLALASEIQKCCLIGTPSRTLSTIWRRIWRVRIIREKKSSIVSIWRKGRLGRNWGERLTLAFLITWWVQRGSRKAVDHLENRLRIISYGSMNYLSISWARRNSWILFDLFALSSSFKVAAS